MLQELMNLIFLGRLNKADLLAGVGVGNMVINFVGMSTIIGFNGALETLVSQAYGAENMQLCGVYLNRARFVLCLVYIPIIFILLNTERCLVAIGQDPTISKYAEQYVVAYIPGLMIAGFNDAQRRFLNMMGKSDIPMIC